MCEAYATRLRSIHLPGDARRTHVKRSRHSLFTTRRSRPVESPESRGTRQCGLEEPGVGSNRTDGLQENRLVPTVIVGPIELPDVHHRIYDRGIETPKVNGMGRANETHTRMGGPFPLVDRGVSISLTPRVSINHGMTIMPLDNKIVVFMCKLRITSHEEVQGGLACLDSSRLKSGPDSSHSARVLVGRQFYSCYVSRYFEIVIF
ncbi:hypothetical protein CRG98_030072 [Punica granatum]|uniref:Uncharacterized protein n=1 Tax=Punica granatum TaxID=22663 RepID=A0A2I0IZY2_PUNGR|nr:hypothetical protein CRG98_030072 [Punica granatum]